MTGGQIISSVLATGLPTDAGLRIRQDAADEEDILPFIIYRRVNVERLRGLDGSLHATRETFHIECWGLTRVACELLESQALLAFDAAGYYPDGNEPDGIDPEVKVRAAVFAVDIWS